MDGLKPKKPKVIRKPRVVKITKPKLTFSSVGSTGSSQDELIHVAPKDFESANSVSKAEPIIVGGKKQSAVPLKKYLIMFGLVVLIFILLNISFFWKNMEYSMGSKSLPTQNQNALPTVTLGPNKLSIPSLNITAPVLYVEENSEVEYQKALQSGVVHYPGTALPGQAGNSYIFGHSSDNIWAKGDYKTIFALLPRITVGSEIFLSDESRTYRYVVTSAFVTNPKDLSVLDQRNYEKKLLTLQTSYPLGTALKRFIVVSELGE